MLVLAAPVLSAMQLAEGIVVEASDEPRAANPAAAVTEFVRLRRDKNNQVVAMQTAVVRLVPRDSGSSLQHVDLIAAVHIGEHAYYQTINSLFTHYDAVLYELVAPQGTRIPKGEKEHKSIVSGMQSWMRDVLDMGMQLEDVDYTAENLVHADLSPEEFSQSMDSRNESVAGMLSKTWLAGMGQQYSAKAIFSEIRLLKNLLSGNRDLALKIFMAEQMVDTMRLGDAIEGREGSTLVAERNKKALAVLRQEIAAGKKKLAIFYGAAHMGDMSRRLIAEFDLVPAWTGWIDAWNLQ